MYPPPAVPDLPGPSAAAASVTTGVSTSSTIWSGTRSPRAWHAAIWSPSGPPARACARSRSPAAMCLAPDQAASRSPWVPLPAPGGASSSSLTAPRPKAQANQAPRPKAQANQAPRPKAQANQAPASEVGRDDDVPLLDLAGRPLGQRVGDPHVPRVLVRRDLALDVVAQLLGGDGGARLEGHRGGDLLAERLVRHADHGGLGDRGMLVEHLLDLARVDVVAAADDQVLLAVHDVEVAVLVDPGQVAGVEPAVADRLGGGLGPLPVALHDVRPADDDLAHLALGLLAVLVVHDPHPDVPDGGADRAGLLLAAGVVERGDRRGLGQAVALQHRDPERLLEPAQHLHRQGRPAGDAD